MPTPTGLPRVGETWRLTRKLPPDYLPVVTTVKILERGTGSYWSVQVEHPDGRQALWVDASADFAAGRFKFVPSEHQGRGQIIAAVKAANPDMNYRRIESIVDLVLTMRG